MLSQSEKKFIAIEKRKQSNKYSQWGNYQRYKINGTAAYEHANRQKTTLNNLTIKNS